MFGGMSHGCDQSNSKQRQENSMLFAFHYFCPRVYLISFLTEETFFL
jgi:hypothetical protein